MEKTSPSASRWVRLSFKLFVGVSLAYFAVCGGLMLADPFRVVQLRPVLWSVLAIQLPLGLCFSVFLFTADLSRIGSRNALIAFALVVCHSFVIMPRLISTAYERWMTGSTEIQLIRALDEPENDSLIPHFAAIELGRRGPSARMAVPVLSALAMNPTRSPDLRLTASEALKAISVPAALD